MLKKGIVYDAFLSLPTPCLFFSASTKLRSTLSESALSDFRLSDSRQYGIPSTGSYLTVVTMNCLVTKLINRVFGTILSSARVSPVVSGFLRPSEIIPVGELLKINCT